MLSQTCWKLPRMQVWAGLARVMETLAVILWVSCVSNGFTQVAVTFQLVKSVAGSPVKAFFQPSLNPPQAHPTLLFGSHPRYHLFFPSLLSIPFNLLPCIFPGVEVRGNNFGKFINFKLLCRWRMYGVSTCRQCERCWRVFTLLPSIPSIGFLTFPGWAQ